KSYIYVLRLAATYSCRDKVSTTIGAEELNYCVRDGNRCDLFAIATRQITTISIIINTLILIDRKSTRLNSSHVSISYAVFCLKKKKDSKYNSITNETLTLVYN